VGGAPLTGIAMNKAIAKVVEKINGAFKLPEDKLDASEVMRQLRGLVPDQADGNQGGCQSALGAARSLSRPAIPERPAIPS
jgi:hypothetical protein